MGDILYEKLTGSDLMRMSELRSMKRRLTIPEKYELQELYVRRWLQDKLYGKRHRVYEEHKAIKIA